MFTLRCAIDNAVLFDGWYMTAQEVIESLCGARLELQDDAKIEQLYFGRHGFVGATISAPSGGVMAPLLEYRILSDDSLTIGGQLWEQIQLHGDELTVLCDGTPKAFKVIRKQPTSVQDPP